MAPSLTRLREIFQPGLFLGTIACILGTATFPLSLVTAAMLPQYSPVTFLVICGFWVYAASAVPLAYRFDLKDMFVPGEMLFILLRAIFLAGTAMTSYLAIIYIPTGDVIAIRFSNSILVSVMGYFLLKEKMSKVHLISTLGVVLGVVFVTKPTFLFGTSRTTRSDAWIGIVLALSSCFFQGAEVIALRKTPKTATAMKMSTANLFVGIAALTMTLITGNSNFPTCGNDFIVALLGGMSILVGYFLMDFSSKMLKAGYSALLRTSSVFFTYCYQVILLDQALTWTSIIGAFTISFFVILPTLAKQYKEIRSKPSTV